MLLHIPTLILSLCPSAPPNLWSHVPILTLCFLPACCPSTPWSSCGCTGPGLSPSWEQRGWKNHGAEAKKLPRPINKGILFAFSLSGLYKYLLPR